MTYNNFFFTNSRLAVIHCGFGFVFLFGSALIAMQPELIGMAMIFSIAFFVLALYHTMKEYSKEYEVGKIK